MVMPGPQHMRVLGPITALLRAGVEPRHVHRELRGMSSHFLVPRVWWNWSPR